MARIPQSQIDKVVAEHAEYISAAVADPNVRRIVEWAIDTRSRRATATSGIVKGARCKFLSRKGEWVYCTVTKLNSTTVSVEGVGVHEYHAWRIGPSQLEVVLDNAEWDKNSAHREMTFKQTGPNTFEGHRA